MAADQIADLKKQIDDLNKKVAGLGGEFFKDIDKAIESFGGGVKGAEAAMKSLRKELDAVSADSNYFYETLMKVTKELKDQTNFNKEITNSYSKLSSLANKLKFDQEGISELSEKDLVSMLKKLAIEKANLQLYITQNNLRKEALLLELQRTDYYDDNFDKLQNEYQQIERANLEAQKFLEDQEMGMNRIIKLTQKELEEKKKVNRAMGISGSLVKGITGSLEKLGIRSEFFENIKEDMEEAAKSGSKLKTLGAGLKSAFAGLGEALRDPVVILTALYKLAKELVKSAIAYQTKFFEAAKTLGVGVTESKKLFENFQGIAWQNGRLAITAKQLVDSYAKINDQLGIMGPMNAEFLTFANGIERRLGLSAADMENVYLYAASTGKSVKETYGNLVATTKINGLRLGFQMTEKQIMQSISKLSATVFNNFKGNVKELALAVQTATKFGTTLEQINTAGMSLLNFEESIAKEFEAQLLTGKSINLSRARQAALTKDTAGLMKEITTQLGTQAEWNRMNVIQQQSLAEAFGLSKEAVDDMYRKQQLVAALGKEANADAATQYRTLLEQVGSHQKVAEIMGERAANEALAASVQDKMAATMERIRDTIGRMSEVLMPVIEGFANIVGNATSLKILLGGAVIASGLIATSAIMAANAKRKQIASLVTEMQLNNVLLSQQLGHLTVLEAQTRMEIIRAGASSTAGSGYLGPLALGVGTAVIAGLMAYFTSAGGSSTSAAAPSISAPASSMSPAGPPSQTSSGGQQTSTAPTAGDQRPMYITFQSQVVDTGAAASGRMDRGVYFDMTKITSPQ